MRVDVLCMYIVVMSANNGNVDVLCIDIFDDG